MQLTNDEWRTVLMALHNIVPIYARDARDCADNEKLRLRFERKIEDARQLANRIENER